MRWTDETLAEYLQLNNPTVRVIGSYKNTKTKIACLCLKCGHTWETIPANLIKGHSCRKCATEKARNRYKKTQTQFERELKESNPYFELVGDYVNYHTPIEVKCKKCGIITIKRPDRLLKGECCPKCSFPTKKTQDRFLAELRAVSTEIEIIGEYKTSRDYINCKCLKCGNEWDGVPHQLLAGVGCPKCNLKNQISYTEAFLYYFLLDYASTKVLSRSSEAIGRELDIFLPERNKAIEFGSWHWHRTRFEKDIEKRKMCEEAKIDLLIIYDGYDGPKLEESWIWTFQSVFTKQNRRQIQELCTLVSEYFEISVNTNSIDWKKIDAEVNHRIKKMDSAEIIRRIDPKSKGFLILDSFNNIHDTVTCQCSSCNNLWKTKITNLLYNRAACKKCSTMGKSRTNIKGVYALDLRGSIIKKYISISEASKDTGVSTSKICSVCKGARKSAGGYGWRYVEEYED